MQRCTWSRLLRQWLSRPRPARRHPAASAKLRRHSARPYLERLEDPTLLSPATYTVNLAGDGGGVAGSQSGTYSGNLRWCINQADLPQNAGSTIVFSPTVFNPKQSNTIDLSNGELPIADNMTITGPGANSLTVSGSDGQGGSRVFDITNSTATVTISGLTITNGNANVYYTTVTGNQGGDIFNGGNRTLTDDSVSNGSSIGTVARPNGRGGAIFNAEGASGTGGATLTLNDTIVETSTATGAGPTGAGEGGVFNDTYATLIVENGSSILDNTAQGGGGGGIGAGGGIYNNQGATLEINGAAGSILISDNLAQGGTGFSFGTSFTGGKGAVGGDGGSGSSGSSGGFAYGGGVFNTSALTGALTLQFINFVGNKAVGGAGGKGGNGGVAGAPAGATENNGGAGGNGGNVSGGNVYVSSTSTATFLDDTIVYGQAVTFGLGGAGGSGAGDGGQAGAGGYFAAAGSSNTIGNTILALNTAAADPDAAGSFLSEGNNLLSSLAGTGTSFTTSGTDQVVTATQLDLGPLLNNGGPTPTDALLPGSVALDAGNNALVPAIRVNDQRGSGFDRIYNNIVDIGAFEFQPPAITTLSPNTIFSWLMDLFFSSPLTASYRDGAGVFAPSGAATMLPPILLDYFYYRIAEPSQLLAQLQ